MGKRKSKKRAPRGYISISNQIKTAQEHRRNTMTEQENKNHSLKNYEGEDPQEIELSAGEWQISRESQELERTEISTDELERRIIQGKENIIENPKLYLLYEQTRDARGISSRYREEIMHTNVSGDQVYNAIRTGLDEWRLTNRKER